ncbi:hypothetical protein ACQ4PT_017457 [Festuca glaucescens]
MARAREISSSTAKRFYRTRARAGRTSTGASASELAGWRASLLALFFLYPREGSWTLVGPGAGGRLNRLLVARWAVQLEREIDGCLGCARSRLVPTSPTPPRNTPPPPAAAMGNSQGSSSSASSARFVMASRAFSKQALDDLRARFASLAARSGTQGRAISRPVFLEYFGVRGALGDRLFQLVAKEGSEEDGVTFEGLIICKATYERGTRDEADEFIFQLCDVMGDGVLTRSDLESVLASLRETIFESNKEAGEGSNKRTSEALLNSAVFSTNAEGVLEKSMSLSDFRNWCIVMPSLRKFLGSLLMPLIQVCIVILHIFQKQAVHFL